MNIQDTPIWRCYMIEKLRWLVQYHIRYNFRKAKEKLVMKFAWLLPRYLVMWCYIRVVAHATTGQYENTIVPKISAVDALKRWNDEASRI